MQAFPAFGQLTVAGYNRVSATLDGGGAWSLLLPGSGWKIGGAIGSAPYAATVNTGADILGAYQELAFAYSLSASSRRASIRIYANRPVALFSVTYDNA